MGERKDYAALYGNRALDAEVAEVVFDGVIYKPFGYGTDAWLVGGLPGDDNTLPRYATSRTAAMDVFFAAVTRFGHAEISCDMEDYGREPGDIVWIMIGTVDDVHWARCGHFAPTMCELLLHVIRETETTQ